MTDLHELIAGPFLDDYLVLRPGSPAGLRISHRKYLELGQAAAAGDVCPAWLVDAARRPWDLDVAGRPVRKTVIVRTRSPYGYGRASYELNLGCNYDCEHCYLDFRSFGVPEGRPDSGRRDTHEMRDLRGQARKHQRLTTAGS
ncbi:MAG: hypothetical protein ACRDYX_23080 [Egibacteraceae bacterium]